MLNNEDKLNIILEAIRSYRKGENDIAILLVENTAERLSHISEQTDTLELYRQVEDIFDIYNMFIDTRNIDLPKVPEEMYELVAYYFNQIIEEIQ